MAGTDYINSNASTDNTAYVVQGRFKLNRKFGLRAYYYSVGAFSVLGDGTFSQDNFPNPGSTGVSNFSGYRLQLDYRAGKNTSIDVRYYSMNRLKDTATLPATGSDALINDLSRNRIQINIDIKL